MIELEGLLENATDDGLPGFAEFCQGISRQLPAHGPQTVPPDCVGVTITDIPAGSVHATPFRHRSQVPTTTPLPAPVEQELPPDGWWPDTAADIIMPGPLCQIAEWCTANVTWHLNGGPPGQWPAPIAFGQDAIYPRARGRYWDLRGGPMNIRLLGGADVSRHTCINTAFAKELFSDLPDQALADGICNGVRFGCVPESLPEDQRMGMQIVLNPNLLACYQGKGIDAVATQIDAMVQAGFIDLLSQVATVPFRINPRSLVHKNGTNEDRGVGEFGAPRKALYTEVSEELVESLNVITKRHDWVPEIKPLYEDAVFNGSLVDALADLNGECVFEIALDYSKYFHRLPYHESEVWQMGYYIPTIDPASNAASSDMSLGVENVMTMGATPASGIAQRFGNAKNRVILPGLIHFTDI